MDNLEERITLTAKMFANIKDDDGSEEAVNSDINIIFGDDETPKTDGRNIYLPTSMNEERLWELLGALLHESLHVRFTNMNDMHSDFRNDKGLFHCLNALEDMRINYKAMKIFPKTKLFFHSLYYYLAKSQKEALLAEPLAFQIIKTLLLSNDEFPVYSKIAEKFIKENNLERFKDIARNARKVQQLEDPARELYDILNKLSKGELSKLGSDVLEDMLKQIRENLANQLQKENENRADLQKELNDLLNKSSKLQKEWKRLHRKQATNETRSETLEREASSLDSESEQEMNNGNAQAANELKEKANHKRNLSSAASYRSTEAETDLSETEQKQQEIQQKIDRLQKLIAELKKKIQELQEYLDDLLKNGLDSEAAGFGYSPIALNGLDALNTDDLCYENSYKLPRTLEDTIREVFLKHKEDREIDDEGKRLNRKNIYRITTDNQNLFENPIQPYDKTKVAFLLDASGSMGGHRAQLVNTSFAYLYNSLNEVLVNENLDVEIGVFSFDHEVYKLKDFSEKKTGEEIISRYRPSGGTHILESLQHVIKKMEESGQNEKRIIILLTDADVYKDELMKIKNSINFEDVKVIFLGVELNYRSLECDIAKQLFMDNIERDSDVVSILTKALIRYI